MNCVLETRSFKNVRIMQAIRKHDTRAADILAAILVLLSVALLSIVSSYFIRSDTFSQIKCSII